MYRWLTVPLCTLTLFAADWKKDVLFRATFDGSLNAATAAGDKTLYSAPTYKETGKPGLEGSGVEHAKGAGRKGDALRFPQKNVKAVYFKAGDNVNPVTGTVSFWLKVDPDQELAPGYCDPIQITDKAYNNSAIWVDFTKDERPRHFRLGVFGALKSWNPNNVPQQALGREDHQRLAHAATVGAAVHLPAQQVEILRRRGAVADLHVVLGAEL
jgi:hypothetical protein